MKVTLDWLKDFVDFDLEVTDLAEKLTMIGLEVEEIIQLKREFKNVIIGQIVQMMPISETGHLQLCQVNIGTEIIPTVCGAPNVKPELMVPIALPGAELAGGIAVQERDFNGYSSVGVICSEAELGLSDQRDGIMVLPSHIAPGTDLLNFLGAGSIILDIAITPNRPDCLSVIGIAREIAGITNSKLRKPVPHFPEQDASVESFIKIEINDTEKCPRYCGRYFSAVKISSSPVWLKERLQAAGVRPINNVVDISNYVMLETGHPLHAFDYDLIADQKIIVRTARPEEQFTTLDGKIHELNSSQLMICDGQKPIALAGIMGGLNSEISDATRNVFMESAYFNPAHIRLSCKRLGISTESSMRFERGADPENAWYAMNRAAQLLHELTDAQAARGVLDIYPAAIAPLVIPLRPERVNQVLGSDLSKKVMTDTLQSIELSVADHAVLQVTVPTFRPDLSREIDLIEEIARLIGYDKIAANLHPPVFLLGEQNQRIEFHQRLRNICVGMGFNEAVTLSMLNPHKAEPFRAPAAQFIRLLNPLSEDLAVMRPSLVPSLLEVVAYNRNRQNPDLKLFEIGEIYYLNADEQSFHPIEEKKLVGIGTGKSMPVSWLTNAKDIDFYDIKGYIEHLFKKLSIRNYQFSDYSLAILQEPAARIHIDGQCAGFVGMVNKNCLSLFDIKGTDVFVFELGFDSLYQATRSEKRFKAISKYPSIPFDLAVVIDRSIRYTDVEQVIRENGGDYLLSAQLFDSFEGKQVPKGKKSMAFSLLFGAMERTLDIDQVNEQVKIILAALAQKFGAYLRAD